MKHQIILVGGQVLPCYYSIKKFAPDEVHFVATEQTAELAKRLKRTIEPSIKGHIHLVDPYRLGEVKDCCEKIHRESEGAAIHYNLTGGTKPMAFAAYRVALEHKAEADYITFDNELLDLNTGEYEAFALELSNEEIILLSGNRVLNKEVIDVLPDRKVKKSKDIMHFMATNSKRHAKLRKWLAPYWDKGCAVSPRSNTEEDGFSVFEFDNSCQLHIRKGGFLKLIDIDDHLLLSLEGIGDYELYYNGRWWETLVLAALFTALEEPSEVWTSVCFKAKPESKEIKNEVDILLNMKTKLLFVECKSGHITQDDIYRTKAVRETYGGDISLSLLVSYYPLEERLVDKCKDAGIIVLAPKAFRNIGKSLQQMKQTLQQLI